MEPQKPIEEGVLDFRDIQSDPVAPTPAVNTSQVSQGQGLETKKQITSPQIIGAILFLFFLLVALFVYFNKYSLRSGQVKSSAPLVPLKPSSK